jgi:hypothetical protein
MKTRKETPWFYFKAVPIFSNPSSNTQVKVNIISSLKITISTIVYNYEKGRSVGWGCYEGVAILGSSKYQYKISYCFKENLLIFLKSVVSKLTVKFCMSQKCCKIKEMTTSSAE